MGLWTAKQVWNSLPRERREVAALALWEDEALSRAARLSALAPWLSAHGMRIGFLEQMPRARRAHLLAEGGAPEETASQALMSYHLQHQRVLLSRFLDELGIPHENGLIKPDAAPESPEAEKVGQAVAKLRAEFPAEDVELYLRALTATDPDTWRAVSEFAGDPT
jgi:hypothetical protein